MGKVMTSQIPPHSLELERAVLGRSPLDDGLYPCPAHDDRTPSLSIRRTADGRVLLHCFAGCRTDDVLAALGLTWADLFQDDGRHPAQRPRGQRRSFSPLAEARAGVLAEARRQRARAAALRPLMDAAEAIRVRLRLADGARRVATTLGAGERVWDALAGAARAEREALVLEVLVDEILAGGRGA